MANTMTRIMTTIAIPTPMPVLNTPAIKLQELIVINRPRHKADKYIFECFMVQKSK